MVQVAVVRGLHHVSLKGKPHPSDAAWLGCLGGLWCKSRWCIHRVSAKGSAAWRIVGRTCCCLGLNRLHWCSTAAIK